MSDSTDPMTRGRFFMNALGHSGKGTERQTDKTHVRLLLILSILVLAVLIIGGIPAAIQFHEHAAVPVAVLLAIVVIGAFVYYMFFEGYYAIYLDEHDRRVSAERAVSQLHAGTSPHAYLLLIRIKNDGKKLLAAYDAVPSDGYKEILNPFLALQTWHDETLKVLQNDYREHWNHFADIGAYTSRGDKDDAAREQAVTLLKRIDDVISLLKPQSPP